MLRVEGNSRSVKIRHYPALAFSLAPATLIRVMKLKETSVSHEPVPEISGREIRAITARIAHPDDPLADWKTELDNWIKAIVDFRELEDERLLRVEKPAERDLRLHRWLLHQLMGVGERLALKLLESQDVTGDARAKSLAQVDAFLGELEDRWNGWHREPNPAHKELLAKFLI